MSWYSRTVCFIARKTSVGYCIQNLKYRFYDAGPPGSASYTTLYALHRGRYLPLLVVKANFATLGC